MTAERLDIETLTTVIARSPIVVGRVLQGALRPAPARRLPEGYADADIAILDWIAAEARRMGRALLRI
jgi:hypothetical protein